MIYCVWYPSGGFGHFVNAVISLHGENFVRPTNSLTFSSSGDSHSLNLSAPKYQKDQDYNFEFLPNVNYSVLVDNGINNEGTKFQQTFPNSKIIKLCYTDYSWPIVAKTMIDKAMHSSIEDELDFSSWGVTEDWAKREKYFLFLRDHYLRHKWRADNSILSINIATLLNYKNFKIELERGGISVSSFKKLWEDWFANNFQYFMPIQFAETVINEIKNKKSINLSSVTDIWTQAILYYYIWLEFNVEVPHNDYANFFSNTKEIIDYLEAGNYL